MKLKFKIQQYQTDAVQNVVKVFNGQPNKGLAEYIVDKGKTYIKENGKLHEVKAIDFDDHTGYKNGDVVNPEKPDVPLNKNDAFQKVQKRRVQEKR